LGGYFVQCPDFFPFRLLIGNTWTGQAGDRRPAALLRHFGLKAFGAGFQRALRPVPADPVQTMPAPAKTNARNA
jgi:hypothetical protein